MNLDLTEEETAALAQLLSRTIDDDKYPLSPRISDAEGHSREDPIGASARAAAAAKALRTAPREGIICPVVDYPAMGTLSMCISLE
jgi:hypothetical protein